MTITQLLKQSGKFFKHRDASYIGHLIYDAAKEKGVRWEKVEEPVFVNDYPKEFEEEMRRIVSDYFQKKSEITKRVMDEMKKEAVPEKKERKRIPVKVKKISA